MLTPKNHQYAQWIIKNAEDKFYQDSLSHKGWGANPNHAAAYNYKTATTKMNSLNLDGLQVVDINIVIEQCL